MKNIKHCLVWIALLIAVRLACRISIYMSLDIRNVTAVILSACYYAIFTLMFLQWTKVRCIGAITAAMMGIDLIAVATLILLKQCSVGVWFLAPHAGAISIAAYLEDQLAGCEETLSDWVSFGIIVAIYGTIIIIGAISKYAKGRIKNSQAV